MQQFTAHYDSLDWSEVKLNKEMFLEQPYTYLSYWVKLTSQERDALHHFISLPDKMIDGTGVFVDSDYDPLRCFIEPEQVAVKVNSFYEKLSAVLGHKALHKNEDLY